MAKFKNIFTWQFTVIIASCFLLSYLTNHLLTRDLIKSTHSVQEVRIINNQIGNGKLVKIDSLSVLKLQNSIDLVVQKNDGRFEVLTWGSAIVITIFIAFLTFNVIVSTGKVREVVDAEIEKKSANLDKIFADKLKELDDMIKNAEEELSELRTVINNVNTNGNV